MKYKYKRKGIEKICIVCNKQFIAYQWNIDKGGGKFCSHSCQGKGENNPFWNGGKTYHERGYLLIRNPDHPYANERGYVNEHRLIMEKNLGRCLLPNEVVHHKNGVKDDNRIENLELFNSQSEHLISEWKNNFHNQL